MSDRERLYCLIDELPEAELPAAERFLAFLRADEPETEEERQAVAEGKAELARGEGIPSEAAWKELLG